MKKFIYCKDAELAAQLSSCYKLISKDQNGLYVFENSPIANHFDFSNIDKNLIAFGDKLFF